MSLILSGDTGLVFPAADVLALVKAVDGSGSGLEADTVPGYGIGPIKDITNGDIESSFTGGGLYYGNNVTGAPNAYEWFYICNYYGATVMNLWAFNTSNVGVALSIKVNKKSGAATWRGWKDVWTSDSDGPGSGLDADTVSGYGIGVVAKDLGIDVSTETVSGGGLYSAYNATDRPTGNFNGQMIYIPRDANNGTLLYFARSTGFFYFKQKIDGTWDAAFTMVWNSGNDGNGGQPPAPKPNATADAKGEWVNAHYQSEVGGGYSNGTSIPLNGTWAVIGLDDSGASTLTPAIRARGTSITSADLHLKYVCWRIA